MAARPIKLLFVVIKEAFWLAVAVAIVAGGILGFRYLGDNKEIVEAEPPARPVALVQTGPLEPYGSALPIRGEGFVQPFRQVAVSAQDGGRVTEIHPAIVARGSFKAGDVLVQLDDRTQRTLLNQSEANIAATEARLSDIREDLDRARSLLERQVTTQTRVDDLEAQLSETEANLRGQIAALDAAEIALGDRQIVAPFDGAVLSRNIESGDVVAAGQQLAVIFTQDELEVDVAIRQADAALIPGLFEGGSAEATVDIPFADYVFRWTGQIERVEPRLDQATRTLTVAVRLQELVGQETGQSALPSGAPPALINAFAKVVINGVQLDSVYRVPSVALRGSNLWMNSGGALEVLPVERVHVDGEWSYVRTENAPTDAQVVLSQLAAPVPGMPLRDIEDRQTAALDTGDAQ